MIKRDVNLAVITSSNLMDDSIYTESIDSDVLYSLLMEAFDNVSFVDLVKDIYNSIRLEEFITIEKEIETEAFIPEAEKVNSGDVDALDIINYRNHNSEIELESLSAIGTELDVVSDKLEEEIRIISRELELANKRASELKGEAISKAKCISAKKIDIEEKQVIIDSLKKDLEIVDSIKISPSNFVGNDYFSRYFQKKDGYNKGKLELFHVEENMFFSESKSESNRQAINDLNGRGMAFENDIL